MKELIEQLEGHVYEARKTNKQRNAEKAIGHWFRTLPKWSEGGVSYFHAQELGQDSTSGATTLKGVMVATNFMGEGKTRSFRSELDPSSLRSEYTQIANPPKDVVAASKNPRERRGRR